MSSNALAAKYSGRILNCYDSHVHWRGTGEWSRALDLRGLTSPEAISQLKIKPHHYRGEWLVGWGWDQSHFPGQKYPDVKTLDQIFPHTPVYFVRVDAHAAWVNSKALELVQIELAPFLQAPASASQMIDCDEQGVPTGVVRDSALRVFQNKMPQSEVQTIREDLLFGQKQFLSAGFTHIRDLTCDEEQWQQSQWLVQKNKLLLTVDAFFAVYKLSEWDRQLHAAQYARQTSTPQLRARGMKIFMDGALGSEGAWISQPYCGSRSQGIQLMSIADLREALHICFAKNLELAIHVIGDEAAHQVVQVVRAEQDKQKCGRVHLEHVQLLRDETLNLMKGLNVICHMQPCHWLSDKAWLQGKVGALMRYAFRWRALEELGLPVYFGSDSPIEAASVQRNWQALLDANLHGILSPHADFASFHSYREESGGQAGRLERKAGSAECARHQVGEVLPTYTDFYNGQPTSICIRGQQLSPTSELGEVNSFRH